MAGYIRQSSLNKEIERINTSIRYVKSKDQKLILLGSLITLRNLGQIPAGKASEFAQDNELEAFYYEEEKL